MLHVRHIVALGKFALKYSFIIFLDVQSLKDLISVVWFKCLHYYD